MAKFKYLWQNLKKSFFMNSVKDFVIRFKDET